MELDKLNNRKIFKHSNELNVCTLNLSSLAYDIFYIIIAQIKQEDTELNTHKIKISDLEKIIKESLNNKSYRLDKQLLIGACDLLLEQKVKFVNKDSYDSFTWFNRISFNKNIITLELSPYLKQYLISVKSQYTMGDLNSFLRLKSVYSKRIYAMACQIKSMKNCSYSLDFLNKVLNTPISISNKYSSFKQRVLEQAKKDINMLTDLNIEYTEIKNGKAVESIKLTIEEKEVINKIEVIQNNEIATTNKNININKILYDYHIKSSSSVDSWLENQ